VTPLTIKPFDSMINNSKLAYFSKSVNQRFLLRYK
jgi:hypothetical protein